MTDFLNHLDSSGRFGKKEGRARGILFQTNKLNVGVLLVG